MTEQGASGIMDGTSLSHWVRGLLILFLPVTLCHSRKAPSVIPTGSPLSFLPVTLLSFPQGPLCHSRRVLAGIQCFLCPFIRVPWPGKNAGFPIKNVGNDRERGIGNDRTGGIGNTGRDSPLSLGEGFVGFSLSLRERARVRDVPKLATVVSDPTCHSPLLPNVGNRYNVGVSSLSRRV